VGWGTDKAYAELGLAQGATEAEVKAAWRRLVSRWHPDRNDSEEAVGMMQRINRAFEHIRAMGFTSAVAPSREPTQEPTPTPTPDEARGEPPQVVRRKVRLSLEEAALGCIRTMQGKLSSACRSCDGAGYHVLQGACTACEGDGLLRQPTWYGWKPSKLACQSCEGSGRARQVCAACDGTGRSEPQHYKVAVRIPHGVRQGDVLHVNGRPVSAGMQSVALELHIALAPHPFLTLGEDGTIQSEMPVDGFAWIGNRTVQVPTLSGWQPLRLRRDQTRYRLHAQGFPSTRRGPRADQVVTVRPVFPDQFSTDQDILLDQLIATSEVEMPPRRP